MPTSIVRMLQENMNEQVSGYINQAPDEQRMIMESVRKIVHENVKGVKEELKWNRPVFSKDVVFLYLKSAKSYVTVGFFDFHKIDDPGNLLEGTGNNMRHIKVRNQNDIDEVLLKRWVKMLVL